MTSTELSWLTTLKKVMRDGAQSSPRGMMIRELLAHTSVADMRHPLIGIKDRRLFTRFAFREAAWILLGRDDLSYLGEVSPKYRDYSDDGVSLAGAYGPRILPQIPYVVRALLQDRDSRRAALSIWTPSPAKSKDIPCTVSMQWLIRDNRLHCIANMRSSDTWLGWPYDVFSFSCVSAYVALSLIEASQDYWTLQLGDLHLFAGSQHVYLEKHEGRVPYGIDEVEPLLTSDGDPDMACVTRLPVNLNEFNNPGDFVEFLHERSMPKEKRTHYNEDRLSLTLVKGQE